MMWGRLQGAVNVVMDSSQEKKKAVPNGIKQVLVLGQATGADCLLCRSWRRRKDCSA